MEFNSLFSKEDLDVKARALFQEERERKRLDGWFIAKEVANRCDREYNDLPNELKAAETLCKIVEELPVAISENAIFAGTQNDAFAKSYALINPTFEVESFTGYCDPTAVFNDIEPNEVFTKERIETLRNYTKETPYVMALGQAYEQAADYTSEAVFFIEQVTGHLIPDFKTAIAEGIEELIHRIDKNMEETIDADKKINYQAMKLTLGAALTLAGRYSKYAREMTTVAGEKRKQELELIADTLERIPKQGASNLYEAIQSYMLLWQVMCIEQAPNPFAFSVGNADRIFEPYRKMGETSREISAGLLKHFLVFFNVGDRSWAISQNVIVGGKLNDSRDLTNETSYALLDAFYEMNLPQPILSVKLHKNTPDKLYQSLGRFFFTPGCLTPSIFNDDSLFAVLRRGGVKEKDLENYSIAGCQEPLIMGKDNANTTNSWLNLAKILELTLTGGKSAITGRGIGQSDECSMYADDAVSLLSNIKTLFYKNTEYFADKMVACANQASEAVWLLPVPFLSIFMGGMESGIDMRDTRHQGTEYNGSGCLIHGLSVVADSFAAIDTLLKEHPEYAQRLLAALRTNFEYDEELRQYLLTCPKYGNNIESVDSEAVEIATKISDMVASKRNYLGNPFRPDWSSPSTHLLYGYWVGATPDGRKAREMLGYGIDPLYGEAQSGLGFRVLSNMRLPFERMNGGYASHFGIDPKYFTANSYEKKGIEFRDRVISPLFFNEANKNLAPFYLYMNVTTPEILRKVLENPGKYAPSGVYIMRIHGTFVNFLDLSPAIQTDIIKRLDLQSTGVL